MTRLLALFSSSLVYLREANDEYYIKNFSWAFLNLLLGRCDVCNVHDVVSLLVEQRLCGRD